MIFLRLFLEFFKIGALTFGGGYAMIPFIQEVAVNNGYMSITEFVNFIAVSESTPGAFAVNISTYVGSEAAGLLGALCSTVGLVLPSFLLIIIIARFYDKYKESSIVSGCLMGLKSTVVGLILSTFVTLSAEIFFGGGLSLALFNSPEIFISLGIFLLSVFLLIKKKISPIIIIVMSAGIGIIAGYAGLISI